MYVCSCNVFTDADVKAVAGPAGGSVAEVYRCLGCRPRCGGCMPTIRKILDKVRSEIGCPCETPCPDDDANCPAVERTMEIVRGLDVLEAAEADVALVRIVGVELVGE